MTLWCVIPAKPFGEAKTRLAPDLPPETRALLAALFLRRTVQKVCGFAGPNPVMVVTRCPEILHLAQGYGAIGVHEGPKADVNTALATASAHAMAHGASGILAVAADLPTITADDLAEMTADPATPALAPDRHGTGSNAVYWPAPRAGPYLFGPDSFRRYLAAMAIDGLQPRIVRRPGLALDIDTLTDLHCLEAQEV
jgi:2-phospho-L-lactate guanylyltransferase